MLGRQATWRRSARLLSAMPSIAPRSVLPARFAGVPLHPRLLGAVHNIGCEKPLPIQASAMPRIYAGESLAIHSETGSGKTLAYMLPLLARLKPWPARQVLLVVPTYALALQCVEVGRALTGHQLSGVSIGDVGFLHARSSTGKSLLEANHALVVMTSSQFGRLQPEIEAEGSTLVRQLRATVETVVVDEVDEVLRPEGKGVMLNRARRTRALQELPAARVLRHIVAKRPYDVSDVPAVKRVQLVCATATLSKRSLRDLAFVVSRECGKIGLAVPACECEWECTL